MLRLLAASFLVLILGFVIGLAERGKTGIGGTVYDRHGNPAGNDLDSILIYNSEDTVNYYYNSGTSYWVTNDSYGLYNDTWSIRGYCGDYCSPKYIVEWESPNWVTQDIHCYLALP